MARRVAYRPTRVHLAALPDFITVPELQRLLRIGRTASYELLRSGAIPSLRFGRILRIPKTALIAHTRNAH